MKEIIRTEQVTVVEECELYSYVRDHWNITPCVNPTNFRDFIKDVVEVDYVHWTFEDVAWCIVHNEGVYKKYPDSEEALIYLEISKILKEAIFSKLLPESFLVRIDWRN